MAASETRSASARTVLVNGFPVELTGPNAHPFKCAGCTNCYRQHRHAARCCKVASEDLRSGAVRDFSADFEAEQVAADEARYAETMALCHYECSCGESFSSIRAAKACRKCRTYTKEGYCTEITDRNQDHKVVWTTNDEH